MPTEIRITKDGSATLFVTELKEHYHSINGAIQESKHVFIDRGFYSIPVNTMCIFELGFGTGLNALLTFLNAGSRKIIYHAIEPCPLSWKEIEKLAYPEFLNLSQEHVDCYKRMHMEGWNEEIMLSQDFSIKKINGSIQEYRFSDVYDLIYYDAFAPGVQPELWNKAIFSRIYNAMVSKGIFVTYCAKGEVRRSLQQVGFIVERLPGPPGKREMLRAMRP